MADWEFADALFATAVAIQEAPCDLIELIAAGDALNHAIFTREQIEHAMRRLVGTGLLWVSNGARFGLTAAGWHLLRRRRGGWFEQIDSVLDLLREIPVEEVAFSLTDEAVRSAYLGYLGSGYLDARGP